MQSVRRVFQHALHSRRCLGAKNKSASGDGVPRRTIEITSRVRRSREPAFDSAGSRTTAKQRAAAARRAHGERRQWPTTRRTSSVVEGLLIVRNSRTNVQAVVVPSDSSWPIKDNGCTTALRRKAADYPSGRSQRRAPFHVCKRHKLPQRLANRVANRSTISTTIVRSLPLSFARIWPTYFP